MKVHRILSGLAVVAIAAGLLWWLLPGSTPVPELHARDATRADLAALRSEVDSLRGATARATRERHATRPDPADGAGPRVMPAREPVPTAAPVPPPSAEQRAIERVEMAAQIDSKFAAEQVDPAWSHDAARRASELLTSTLSPGSRLGHVECRANLCRVESFHTDLESFRSFVDVSFLSRDRKIWNGGFSSIVVDISESGVKALNFIAREGQSIPAVEPSDG